MSTRTISRIARQSQPTLDPPPKLPPLICGIFKNGKLESISEREDPRDLFCSSFNLQAAGWGLSARPLDDEEVVIARKLLAERAVAND